MAIMLSKQLLEIRLCIYASMPHIFTWLFYIYIYIAIFFTKVESLYENEEVFKQFFNAILNYEITTFCVFVAQKICTYIQIFVKNYKILYIKL